jgi:hypothetical protein
MNELLLHKDWCCYMTGGFHGKDSGANCCCGAGH